MDILLVDDSITIRKLLGRLLAGLPGLRVVGETGAEHDALVLVESLRPDLVLLDIQLQPGNGLNVLRAIRSAGHACRVLMLTNHPRPHYAELAQRLGADGFFDKSYEIEALLQHLAGLAAP
jgi:DNA-binding NarL/FixJ family response regulator